MGKRGFFGIGIVHPKSECNIGTLFRSAFSFGADFIFTVGKRYREQASDTCKAKNHLPLYHYLTVDDLVAHLPFGCQLVGLEYPLPAQQKDNCFVLGKDGEGKEEFKHPDRACYLLGAEDHGLTSEAISKCHKLLFIDLPVPTPRDFSLNVSVAGSIVMYDRIIKRREKQNGRVSSQSA